MEKNFEDLKAVLEAVNDINSFLIRCDFSLRDVLSVILEKAVSLSGADYGQILLYDGYELVIEASSPDSQTKIRLLPENCICGEVVATNRPLIVEDVSANSKYNRFFSDAHSELAVPLTQNGKIIGVLNVESRSTGAFGETHLNILNTLGLQAAHSIKIAHMYDKQKILAEIKEELAKYTGNAEQIYRQIIGGALRLINGKSGQLLIREGEYLIITATTGSEKPMTTVVDIDNSVSGLAVKEKKTVSIGDLGQPQYSSLYKSYLGNMKSELVIPIADQNEIIGVLNFEHPSKNFFTREDMETLQSMTNMAAIAIKNIQIAERFGNRLGEVKTLIREMEGFPEKLNKAISGIKNIAEELEKQELMQNPTLLPPTGDY